MLRTVRHGEPDAPTTITGPKDAILRPLEKSTMVWLAHNHVRHDGLEEGGDPEDVESYAHQTIQCAPPGRVNTYLKGLVIKPAAIGTARQALVKHSRSNDVEIGEFEVIGPAGLNHLLGGEEGHNGEIVYLGNAAGQLHAEFYPWDTVDQSSDIHIHHIDNSAGHPHAEMVDVKAGVSDVLIEYCTDGGGFGRYTHPDAPPTSEAAFHLIGNETTLRWCVVTDGHGRAVEIAGDGAHDPEGFEADKGFPLPDAVADSGRNNSVYGNRFVGNPGLAIRFPIETATSSRGSDPMHRDRSAGTSTTVGRMPTRERPVPTRSHEARPSDTSVVTAPGVDRRLVLYLNEVWQTESLLSS